MNNIFLLLLATILVLVKSRNINNLNLATRYLERYGYMNKESSLNNKIISSSLDISKPILTFQEFANIPKTGYLDELTISTMKKKRCGNPDFFPKKHREKRFTAWKGWDKNNLYWYLSDQFLNNFINKTIIENDIKLAFDKWSKESSLIINKATFKDYPDIKISFEEDIHNDGFDFYDTSILAHAFFPKNGQIHFNKDVNWNIKRNINEYKSQTDFYSVTLHEIGHVLGLAHSSSFESVMYPWYNFKNKTKNLSLDDIYGINQLYPSKKKRWSKSPYRLYTYRTIFDKKLYNFLPNNKVVSATSNYKIFEKKDKWDNIYFDSVYQQPSGNIVFFYGQSYLVYDRSSLYNKNTTKNIVSGGTLAELGLPKHVKKIKVAFRMLNQTYFISNKDYWVFDENIKKVNRRIYKKKGNESGRNIFKIVENNLITSVVEQNNKLFIFTMNKTYIISNNTIYNLVYNDKPQLQLSMEQPEKEKKNNTFIIILAIAIFSVVTLVLFFF